MNRCFIILLSLFLSISLVAQQEFQLGTDTSSDLCEGVLYDSGGENGEYQPQEDFSFTICPTMSHACLVLNVETYDIETPLDQLLIFSGRNTSGDLLAELNGSGANRSIETADDCFTVQFKSDETVQNDGFKISWNCGSTPCSAPSFSTCATPYLITSLPFDVDDFTTCGAGNSLDSNPCNQDYLENEEFVFAYDSPGNECLELRASNIPFNTGLGVYAECPDVATECLAYDNSFLFTLSLNAYISDVKLEEPGRYYFVLGHPNQCADFDLEVNRIDCPVTFPTASRCEDALPITGCNIDVPAEIKVELGNSEAFFIQNGRNNGCWGGIVLPNFSWFYFQAQADGKFGFLVESLDSGDMSDYDINVWGPLNSPNEFCNFSRNNQPIRSTFADDNDENGDFKYELTGLSDNNPITGTQVFDECEDEFGDAFVTRLDVREGEYYIILVNDFDGIINDGGVSIDFSNTTIGVLGSPDDNFSLTDDLSICSGGTAQLEADGGLIYRWLNPDFLSCASCPNPITSPSKTTTYELEIIGVCNSDTLEVTVFVDEFNFENDLAGCAGEDLILDTGIQNGSFSWVTSDGDLSCADCPNPTLTLPMNENEIQVIFEAEVNSCSFSDTIIVEVMPNTTVEILPEEVMACVGESVTLKTSTSIDGGDFLWSTGDETEAIDIEVTADTVYSVSYQSPNGCGEANDEVEVFVSSGFTIEDLQLIPGSDTLYVGCELQASLSILPIDLSNLTYEWFFNDQLVSTNEQLNATVEEEGELTIEARVTFDQNCTQSISIKRVVLPFEEIVIPNIFSPNGDSRNEIFMPQISPKANLVEMKIYNRWGQLIYNNDSNQIGWEGKFNGSDQPTGVYIYQILVEMPNGQMVPRTGDVTLLR